MIGESSRYANCALYVDDRIEFIGGRTRIEIRKILYQPEPAGDYHL